MKSLTWHFPLPRTQTGVLLGTDTETALQIGGGTSGYYGRTAQSPAALELATFLGTLGK